MGRIAPPWNMGTATRSAPTAASSSKLGARTGTSGVPSGRPSAPVLPTNAHAPASDTTMSPPPRTSGAPCNSVGPKVRPKNKARYCAMPTTLK